MFIRQFCGKDQDFVINFLDCFYLVYRLGVIQKINCDILDVGESDIFGKVRGFLFFYF